MTPTSPSAVHTMLPPVQINKVTTPYISNHRQQSHEKFYPRKATHSHDFTGCSRCPVDAESTVNIIKYVLYHNEKTCILLDNTSIREKSVRESERQNSPKNPPTNKPKKELDFNRKTPCLAVIQKTKSQNHSDQS
eukprot:2351614-Ditylum_brightwellii.AAC.1